MSELTNPLFDEEKEFLERKKLEYERALRGDVEDIKEKSAQVGRVALVGAGLAGSVWLITKLFSSKDKPDEAPEDDRYDEADEYDDYFDGFDDEEEEYYTAGNGQRYKAKSYQRSAAESASVFQAHDEARSDAESSSAFAASSQRPAPGHDQEGGPRRGGNILSDSEARSAGPARAPQSAPDKPREAARPASASARSLSSEVDDPFQDLPYDDSRRLPATHEDFDQDEENYDAAPRRPDNESYFGGGTRMVGSVLQTFLQSDTGKMLVAQTAAVALAMITKKVSEFFPADKNDDLAVSPGYEPVKEGFSPTTSEPAHPSDEFTNSPPQPKDL